MAKRTSTSVNLRSHLCNNFNLTAERVMNVNCLAALLPIITYDRTLQSKTCWAERELNGVSAINASSVKYDIINNCKSKQLPKNQIDKMLFFANKKSALSKFVDFQSSNCDKICLAFNVKLSESVKGK